MGSRMSVLFINAQDLLSNVVPIPGGGVIVQLYAPGVGDVNLYFSSLGAAAEWMGRLSARLSLEWEQQLRLPLRDPAEEPRP